MESLGVVIPVYNQFHLTERCLSSLLANSSQISNLLVIDNASTDHTAQGLGDWKQRFDSRRITFDIIHEHTNTGFGRAMNRGLRSLKTEYAILLNNDTLLPPSWDQRLLRSAIKNQSFWTGAVLEESTFDPVRTPALLERCSIKNAGRFVKQEFCSVISLVPRKRFLDFGAFDERYFVTSEDRDVLERLMHARLRYGVAGDVWVWHFSKGTRESGVLPKGYEEEGLKIFREKWGYDPRSKEASFMQRFRRRLRKRRRMLGFA